MDNKQPTKRVHVYGKSMYKPTVSIILVCACGNKYIKTRDQQTACIKCFAKNRKPV